MRRIAKLNYMAPGCLHLLFLLAAVFLIYNLQNLVSWREKTLVLGEKKMSPSPSTTSISLNKNSYYSRFKIQMNLWHYLSDDQLLF